MRSKALNRRVSASKEQGRGARDDGEHLSKTPP